MQQQQFISVFPYKYMVLPTKILEKIYIKIFLVNINKFISLIILQETVLNPYINEHKQLYVDI